MAQNTFKGGIHPFDGKALTKDCAIRDCKADKLMVYPLSQHIGAPAKLIVNIGDYVKRGQLIAETASFVSANIYSSVSGTVKSVEKRRVATGDMVDSVIIENDEQYAEEEYVAADPEELSSEEIIERIKKAGIVGMGGAGFPTHVKLSPKDPNKIFFVIVNGAECEPYLTSDYRRMKEEPEKLLLGLRAMLKLFPHAHGIFAIEDNKPDCIKTLRSLTKNDNLITVRALKTKYPQGGERQLVYATTGRKLNSSMLPSDVGCVVNNIDTVYAIYNAVYNGIPLMERIITVTGDAITNPCNLRVKTGTSYNTIIEEAGGFSEQPEKIICGGPMMGFSIFDTDIPVTKTSTALLAFKKDNASLKEAGPCINCGKCVEVCPGRIIPTLAAEYAKAKDEENFIRHNGMECCECGSCSYICPAKRPLTQEIKTMRKIVLANKKK